MGPSRFERVGRKEQHPASLADGAVACEQQPYELGLTALLSCVSASDDPAAAVGVIRVRRRCAGGPTMRCHARLGTFNLILRIAKALGTPPAAQKCHDWPLLSFILAFEDRALGVSGGAPIPF